MSHCQCWARSLCKRPQIVKPQLKGRHLVAFSGQCSIQPSKHQPCWRKLQRAVPHRGQVPVVEMLLRAWGRALSMRLHVCLNEYGTVRCLLVFRPLQCLPFSCSPRSWQRLKAQLLCVAPGRDRVPPALRFPAASDVQAREAKVRPTDGFTIPACDFCFIHRQARFCQDT